MEVGRFNLLTLIRLIAIPMSPEFRFVPDEQGNIIPRRPVRRIEWHRPCKRAAVVTNIRDLTVSPSPSCNDLVQESLHQILYMR